MVLSLPLKVAVAQSSPHPFPITGAGKLWSRFLSAEAGEYKTQRSRADRGRNRRGTEEALD